MKNSDGVTFLIVDDDQVSVMAIKRAINKLRLTNPIEVANDGREALDILRGTPGQPPLQKPYIILLDINMPRMNGLEFLAEVREDHELARSVVFILTTSDAPSDIAAAYEHKTAGYIIKEDPQNSVRAAMELLNAYTEIVSLET